MKYIMLTCFLLTGITYPVLSQSSIYACPETGAIGYSYGGSASGLDQVELNQIALEYCRESGGIDCQFLFYVTCNGCWVSVMAGLNGNALDCSLATSHLSEQDARDKVWISYNEQGYAYPDYAKRLSWWVPE
jgi:hypothetical protein